MALYATGHPERLGRTILLDGIPLRMSELAEAFQQLDASRDTASRRRLEEAEAAMRANPEDPAACRAYYAIWFHPFFIEPGGPASRRLEAVPEAARRCEQRGERDRYTFPSLGAYDWRRAMAQVQAPTLVIHGDKDFIPVETAREWATTMPNARLFVMRGYGHSRTWRRPSHSSLPWTSS